ncbi:uncharacterized protein LOC108626033 isoform X2 [Ceratina calcarata]|uniref:Uncharacterized protein LOC108626033 isoform X2 n=1 Tax=Ceratina calcarata TaxID=156304 RepID=A0AAJ7N7U4_9HYME|nr:uncharacterized protein LOC108626033 isoform X2 [Ceratina calcarata]
MASVCGSNKSYPAMNTGGYYRPGAYPYQNDYYLPPRSTWSRVSPQQTKKQRGSTTWKIGSAMLIVSAMLVLIAVLAIAGLALWMGALRTDSKNAIVGFSCSFRVSKGEKYNPMLKLNTSMVFRERERKYKNIFELLFRRSVLGTAYKQTIVDKFESGLLKVFFRIYLDRRKVPRSITNVEDTIEDIIAKETYSSSSLFKDVELDLASISVKRMNQDVPGAQKQAQRNAMITKNGLLRPNRNSTLITSKQKSRPSKIESTEPEIDFSDIPTIQGTYTASKVNVSSSNKTTNFSQESTTAETVAMNNTKVSLPQRQTTNEPSTVPETAGTTQRTVQTTDETRERTNYTVKNESSNGADHGSTKKLVTSTDSTTPIRDDDLFEDFRKPDLETSPWRPIIPGYGNPELKLLPGGVEKTTKTDYKVNHGNSGENTPGASTKTPEHDVPSRVAESSTARIDIAKPLEMIAPYVDVPGMSTFDVADADFPRDRVVPQEVVNFRVNGKFKNKLSEDGQMFAEAVPVRIPDIEVAGQLPPETYDVELRTPSLTEKTESSFAKPDRLTDENETGWRVSDSRVTYPVADGTDERNEKLNVKTPDPIETNKEKMGQSTGIEDDEGSDGFLASTGSSTLRQEPVQGDSNEESTTNVSGVGVAEPVPDVDVDLEARNRYSGIQTVDKRRNDGLQDRKVDKNAQEPVYTSYKTPDLNGAGIRPSLIESSGTLKPFRHTIPVDKIASVVDDTESRRNGSSNQEMNAVTHGTTGGKFTAASDDKPKETWTTSSGIQKEIIELKTFDRESNDTNVDLRTNGSAATTKVGAHESAESSTESSIDNDKFLKLSTTEVYSETIRPLYDIADKLIAKNEEKHKEVAPERSTASVSRNSTFIEIDTLKHTPGEGDSDSSESNSSSKLENDRFPNATANRSSNSVEAKKKIYNDTLKAYVVENLVTLAPVKSNTGIGRPVRPRPKIDREKTMRTDDASDDRSSSDDAVLLERLFGAQSRDGNTTKRDSSDRPEGDQEYFHNGTVEQIVEVVTSTSTKVSSSIKGSPVVLKFIVTNSTSLPVIRTEYHEEQTTTYPKEVSVNEENRSFKDQISVKEKGLTQTFDRKISTIDENEYLLDRLKQLADVGVENEPAKSKNDSRPESKPHKSNVKLNTKSEEHRPLPDFEKLREIADVATGNETLMNSSAAFTMTRDGVEILTKILNKMEDRTDKMISTTEENLETDDCLGFLCKDGKCLPSSGRCNMLGECPSSEDEANCTCADFLRAQLLQEKICDGVADCWDYSDETDCDWCEDGQFVCGNSRSCVDQDRVCNGYADCPGGEDEKKCTALIEEDSLNYEESNLDETENTSNVTVTRDERPPSEDHFPRVESTADKDVFYDQEAVESSISESTTLHAIKGQVQLEKITVTRDESVTEEKALLNATTLVSGREISPHAKDAVTHGNSIHVNAKNNDETPVTRKEIDNYNEKGYLNVRKNGKWGKLCLGRMHDLAQERQAAWTIEDLGRAVCKAITYQDYDTVEKVLDENPTSARSYYALSYSEKAPDKTILTFKPSECPSGEILRVKCKNLECGIRTQAPSQARIVGGGSSSAGSWPWQVALYKEGDYQCGGALINDRWILSAAHCFYHAQDEYWVARIGATRRGSFPSPYEQVLRLDHISLHPDYIDNGFINDIAMLRLEAQVTFSDYVRPVCLPQSEPRSGTMCTVTGWGQLFEIGRIFPDTLQEVQLPVISTEECRRKTLFLPLYRITSGMLCAGLKDGGRDACLGDSGGPLVCSGSDNKYTLHGITSNGYGCARPGRPGVYTKVHHYLPWIEYTISNEDVRSITSTCKGHRCPLGECLPKSRICNGFLECSDGSDERNCPANF